MTKEIFTQITEVANKNEYKDVKILYDGTNELNEDKYKIYLYDDMSRLTIRTTESNIQPVLTKLFGKVESLNVKSE